MAGRCGAGGGVAHATVPAATEHPHACKAAGSAGYQARRTGTARAATPAANARCVGRQRSRGSWHNRPQQAWCST